MKEIVAETIKNYNKRPVPNSLCEMIGENNKEHVKMGKNICKDCCLCPIPKRRKEPASKDLEHTELSMITSTVVSICMYLFLQYYLFVSLRMLQLIHVTFYERKFLWFVFLNWYLIIMMSWLPAKVEYTLIYEVPSLMHLNRTRCVQVNLECLIISHTHNWTSLI